MSLVTKVSDLATRVGTEFKAVRSSIGSLASLTTTDQTSIVAAINEVATYADNGGQALTDHINDTLNVHGITDTAALETQTGAQSKADAAQAAAETYADGLAVNYDAAGAAASAQTAAQAYADSLAVNYDPAGSAAAAQTAAESYADSAIASLVDAAPATLDTLNEIAAALGDDPNFTTTITTALGLRVRVDASQTFDATQQGTARTNIGAAASADVGDTATNFVTVFEAALV